MINLDPTLSHHSTQATHATNKTMLTCWSVTSSPGILVGIACAYIESTVEHSFSKFACFFTVREAKVGNLTLRKTKVGNLTLRKTKVGNLTLRKAKVGNVRKEKVGSLTARKAKVKKIDCEKSES